MPQNATQNKHCLKNILAQYGSRERFQEMANLGYTRVTFASSSEDSTDNSEDGEPEQQEPVNSKTLAIWIFYFSPTNKKSETTPPDDIAFVLPGLYHLGNYVHGEWFETDKLRKRIGTFLREHDCKMIYSAIDLPQLVTHWDA